MSLQDMDALNTLHRHLLSVEKPNLTLQRVVHCLVLAEVSEGPDVYVTVVEITVDEGASIDSLESFELRGLPCKVEIKVEGTAAQLAAMVPMQSGGGLFGFASFGDKTITESFAGLADALGINSSATGADAAKETKVLPCIDILLDLEKAASVPAVVAKVIANEAFHQSINSVMAVSAAEKYVEAAVSKRMTQEVLELQSRAFVLTRVHGNTAELPGTRRSRQCCNEASS